MIKLFRVPFTFCAVVLLAWPGVALGAPARTASPVVSLAGEWRFALDRQDVGVAQRWFERSLPDRIKLPGILQAQGYGDEISTDTPWVETLGDAWWKLQPSTLREKFSRPGHVMVPFLAQPPRHYLGAAWYQRDITIPDTPQPRRYALFLERAHWETTVWIDDHGFAANDSLVAPHETDLGILTAGRHRLTVRVDNRQIVRAPSNDGHMADAHSVSDALGATWNGIVGRIELQATPLVWIAAVQVFPDVATRTAKLKIAIGNASGRPGRGEVAVQVGRNRGVIDARPVHRFDAAWAADGGVAECTVPLRDRAETWDEFRPALQAVDVTLNSAAGQSTRNVAFGLREVGFREKDLLINGRVVNLRMTHFGGDFPLTGYPATDVESWKRIYRVCQDYGLNGMRFHSWCPPEAAFTAADEMGFYLQPECGLWAPLDPGGTYTRFLAEETPRLLAAYGNHPSFILLSPSNEPGGRYTEVTPKWAADCYARDARRLYSAGTGWNAPEQVKGGAQFAVLVRYGKGELRNVKGWFGHDYRLALEDVHIPVLSHEVGQWCAYPDFDVIREFTGYLRPSNYHIFRAIAEHTGVLEFDHAFAWASGRFQLECYKEEIEANLRTPGLSGYQLLDLHDYLGQGTALIGLVDAFWKPKGYVDGREFRRFNSETVPLVRLAKRTFTTADTLSAEVELYHFSDRPLESIRPYWRLVSDAGKTVAAGDLPPREVATGKNIPLGTVHIPLAEIPSPAAYKLVVGLADTPAENDWNIWVYPAQIDPAVPKDVTITSSWSEAEHQLATGRKVLFIPGSAELDPAKSPAMSDRPVFWNIQMTVRPPRNLTPKFDAMLGLLCDAQHPALNEFPTQSNCDWQWTPLIAGVRSVNLTGAPRSLRPIVATIDDWNRNWRLGVIFECTVGDGRLLVCTLPLEKPDASAGMKQLRRSLLDYMAGEKFRPSAKLTADDVRALWKRGPLVETHAHAFDPDLDDGSARPSGSR